ncbi:hypothetical protein [Bradyrhizobium sp. SHOUNA76]|uniref:hypothetical protein n=1 Tax=Bradyrhizobium sp. SHOUNA76 TaxID=2908927 RepID=UPI001FF207E1|nr:hypothetical protein [Bradyrhizobium sp. SHOUNA76]MCJ9700001.1 hypothetical protein [Bradyrhizobium sp. SHOUNA76]
MTREDQLAKLARQADKQKALAERERKFHEMQDSYYIHYAIDDKRAAAPPIRHVRIWPILLQKSVETSREA